MNEIWAPVRRRARKDASSRPYAPHTHRAVLPLMCRATLTPIRSRPRSLAPAVHGRDVVRVLVQPAGQAAATRSATAAVGEGEKQGRICVPVRCSWCCPPPVAPGRLTLLAGADTLRSDQILYVVLVFGTWQYCLVKIRALL